MDVISDHFQLERLLCKSMLGERFDQSEEGQDSSLLALLQSIQVVHIQYLALDPTQEVDGINSFQLGYAIIQSSGVFDANLPCLF